MPNFITTWINTWITTLGNDIAIKLCAKPNSTIHLMLGIELGLVVILSIIVGTRFFLRKYHIIRINHWTYKYPKLLRYGQSPVWFGLFGLVVGVMIFHLGVIYPGAYARLRSYDMKLQPSAIPADMTSYQISMRRQTLICEQITWKFIVEAEHKYKQPYCQPGPFERWGVFTISSNSSAKEIDQEATSRMNTGYAAMLCGGIMMLLGLLATWFWSTRQKIGQSDHGQAAWAARSELIYSDTGYWWLPLRVMSRGQREIASLASAPLTVARPPAKTNIVHTAIIGSSGSGKGAYLGGHLFATSTVPIIYFDYKGEMPAAVLRPKMLRWGFPSEQPKGLPSLRFNFIAWVLNHQDPDLAAKTLAGALLPTNPGKETENQWIKDTAIPILAQGILSGRWHNLAELADEIEHSSFTTLLNNLEIGAGRMFSMGGRNVPQYASNEISNNTAAYLSGRARHIVTSSDFTMQEVFSNGLYIMGQATSSHEKRVLRLFWAIFWFELLRKSEPMPLCVFVDEGIANGPIPNILEALVTLRDRGISLIQCFQFHSGITTVYGRDLAKAVFDGHQTHIWLTKGLADSDIKEISQSLKTYTHTRKTRQEVRHESRYLLSEETLKRHARQEKYWAVIDGPSWTTSGRPVIAALVPINLNHWNWRANNKFYQKELTRLGYGNDWRSPYKMRVDDIIEKLEGSTKNYYQKWVPVYPQEAARRYVKERLVPINQDEAMALRAHLLANKEQEVIQKEETLETKETIQVTEEDGLEIKKQDTASPNVTLTNKIEVRVVPIEQNEPMTPKAGLVLDSEQETAKLKIVVQKAQPHEANLSEVNKIPIESLQNSTLCENKQSLTTTDELKTKWQSIKDLPPADFRKATGVEHIAFTKMIDVLQIAHDAKTVLRIRPNSMCIEDMLLMTLERLIEHRTYFDISNSYNVSKGHAHKTIKWIKDVLIESKTFRLLS